VATTRGLRSLRDLTQHLTARADDSHAPHVSVFLRAPLYFIRLNLLPAAAFIARGSARAFNYTMVGNKAVCYVKKTGSLSYVIKTSVRENPDRALSSVVYILLVHPNKPLTTPLMACTPGRCSPLLGQMMLSHAGPQWRSFRWTRLGIGIRGGSGRSGAVEGLAFASVVVLQHGGVAMEVSRCGDRQSRLFYLNINLLLALES
jgi:hypothetical protein